ncbi:MAG: hypothetical protein FVQ81_02120 [Candidatus Glassbacteria bacterium]|nr:hypothetical protein [Candidatus Glassbacteria bacterium]
MSEDTAGKTVEGIEKPASTEKPAATETKDGTAKPADTEKAASVFSGRTFVVTGPDGEPKTLKGDQTLADLEAAEKAKEEKKSGSEEAGEEETGEKKTEAKKEKPEDPEKAGDSDPPDKPEDVDSDLIAEDDPTGVKKRIGKAVIQRKEEERKNAALQAELDKRDKRITELEGKDSDPDKKGDADPEKKAEKKTDQADDTGKPVKPVVSDFENYDDFEVARDEYIEKMTDWKVDQALKGERTKREQDANTALDLERQAEDDRKIAAAVVQYEDFEEVAMVESLPYTPLMVEEVYESDNFTELAYHLGKNPEEVKRIAALSQKGQIRELAKVDMQLRADGKTPITAGKEDKPAKKRTTAAAEPIKTVSGAGDAEPFDANTASPKALKEHLDNASLARIRGEQGG